MKIKIGTPSVQFYWAMPRRCSPYITSETTAFPIDITLTKAGNNQDASPTPDHKDSLFAKFLNIFGLWMNYSSQNTNNISTTHWAANIIRAHKERVPVFLSKWLRWKKKSDSLEFWTDYFQTFLYVSEITCMDLAMPATLVSSESAFSIAGHFRWKQCSSMTAKSLELQMFLSAKF